MLTAVTTNSIPKEKVDYNQIYLNAFRRSLEQRNIQQSIYYGVKYVITMPESQQITMDDAMLKFGMINVVIKLISLITPAELIQIFPVTKRYDGDRYETKDYFSTMQELTKIGLNEIIGEKVEELLWDYQNFDIMRLSISQLSVVDDIRRFNGQKGIIEDFFGIPTYTQHKDASGREYLQDNTTGRTMKVKRKLPRYIKRVK